MAFATGILLIVLMLVAMPLKYLAGVERPLEVVAPMHGWVYLVYLIVTVDLASRRRWAIGRTVLLLLAGTVPFMSFVAERNVVRHERLRLAGH
jgi:integral membrane protein